MHRGSFVEYKNSVEYKSSVEYKGNVLSIDPELV